MSEHDLHERYEFLLGWLQRRRAHIAAAVMRLGRLRLSEHVRTAAIVARGEEVWLYFQPEFCERINNAELAGVLTHEALHFVLRHQQRTASLTAQRDRYYFRLACEAVVNDLILASFPEMKLPGDPVTGPWLVGRDTSQMAAEEVMQLLGHQRVRHGRKLDDRLANAETLDDHSPWEADPRDAALNTSASAARPRAEPLSTMADWTDETSALVATLLMNLSPNDPCFGTVARGIRRRVPPAPNCRKSLAQFLEDMATGIASYDAVWTTPNRKLLALYPRVVLPSYPPRYEADILMAIDASGSVPARFLSVALAFARQRRPQSRVRLISFDTACYEASAQEGSVRGGGGTRVQAVEEYIQAELPAYPDLVFLLTDGQTPSPCPRHPERWIWLLPPWGSTGAVPRGSRTEYFACTDLP
ncbi:MAG TPA: hypothetical protein P5534_04410 [Candidatus Paceibacterota bacterium]|nr:hypothetical protein [Candidatus Paceibacterota bacterium]HRZ54213.1 hypothetical protein [Candidatus Paceibacterota bacterium]